MEEKRHMSNIAGTWQLPKLTTIRTVCRCFKLPPPAFIIHSWSEAVHACCIHTIYLIMSDICTTHHVLTQSKLLNCGFLYGLA